MSIIQKEYKKLTRYIFALTFGHQNVPPMAQQMSKNTQLELQAMFHEL
jgi:hypothetical protein